VSDPTRLFVPFEAMSSALNTNNAGMPFCGKVESFREARGPNRQEG
jgi:hypothetical protein